MARRKPRKGDTFRYTGGAPLAGEPGPLFAGAEVTVREYVDAGEPGAHDDEEDAVVIEWPVASTVISGHDDDGAPIVEQGTTLRAFAVGIDGRAFTPPGEVETRMPGFHDLFELVAEAPAEEEEVTDDAG